MESPDLQQLLQLEIMNKVRLFAIVNNVYQEFIDGPFQDHYTREVVATFDNEELAKEYKKIKT